MSQLKKVALLIETSSAYGRELLGGINHYARLHGPWSFYMEPCDLETLPPTLDGWGAHGVIARIHTEAQAERIQAMGLPTVDMDYAFPDLFPKAVSNHDAEIGRMAARHLMDCGLEHFAFCGYAPPDSTKLPWEAGRAKSFLETVRAEGLKGEHYPWPKRKRDWEWAREQGHLSKWLESLPKPLGVMGSDDQRARHVLTAAQAAGLRVPHDVAVVGVDNDELLCEMSTPSLTSIALPTERLGYQAAQMLDKMMRGEDVPNEPVVFDPVGLIPRQSTDTLAMRDDQIVRAVRYIRSNAHKGIRVLDVLKVVPMSRKTLEVGCRKALGRTPHAEIQRVRLERVKHLLVQTDWPLKRIASDCGFAYAEHMHTVFRREVGVTPKQYRAMRRGA